MLNRGNDFDGIFSVEKNCLASINKSNVIKRNSSSNSTNYLHWFPRIPFGNSVNAEHGYIFTIFLDILLM